MSAEPFFSSSESLAGNDWNGSSLGGEKGNLHMITVKKTKEIYNIITHSGGFGVI